MKYAAIGISILLAASMADAQDVGRQTFVTRESSRIMVDSSVHLLNEREPFAAATTLRRSDLRVASCVGSPGLGNAGERAWRYWWQGSSTLNALVPSAYAVVEFPFDQSATDGQWQQRVARITSPIPGDSMGSVSADIYVGTVDAFPHIMLPPGTSIGQVNECRVGLNTVMSVNVAQNHSRGRFFVLTYGRAADGVWWSFLGEASNKGHVLELEKIARSMHGLP